MSPEVNSRSPGQMDSTLTTSWNVTTNVATDSELLLVNNGFRFAFGAVGLLLNSANLLIICITRYRPGLNVYMKMVVSLALSDLTIDVAMCSGGVKNYGKLNIVLKGLFFSGTVSSLGILTCIALDHYVRVLKPSKHKTYFSGRKVTIQLCALWLSSSFLGLCRCLTQIFPREACATLRARSLSLLLTVLNWLLVVTSLVCSVVILSCYTAISIYWWRRSYPGQESAAAQTKRLLVTSMLVVVTFSVCWFPVFALLAFHLSTQTSYWSTEASCHDYGRDINLEACVVVNTVLDGLIYAVRLDVIRQGYANVFRRGSQLDKWTAQIQN